MNEVQASRVKVKWAIIALVVVVGALAIIAGSDGIKAAWVYHQWEVKQREILKDNRGNGLAPLPEKNPDYQNLVNIGRRYRPFLVRQLANRLNERYPDDQYHLYSVPRYIAFAISDASDWNRSEVESEADQKNMDIDHYVLWRLANEASKK